MDARAICTRVMQYQVFCDFMLFVIDQRFRAYIH